VNILFIAAECAPFVKVGGLGDVVGALPTAIHDLGHSVRVFLPHYGAIDDEHFGVENCQSFPMRWNDADVAVEVACVEKDGVPHYLLRGWPIFAAEHPAIYHLDEGMDVGRFLFFSAASLAFVKELVRDEGWKPDIYHVHDWHTAYVPYLLQAIYDKDTVLGKSPTLFSIHNMRYQGWGLGWHLDRAGIPPVDHPLLQAMGRTDNSLAIGLAYSTMLNTVSPTYAEEITTDLGGFGLDGLLHARLSRLVGVLNGIDTDRWSPSNSVDLIQPFDVKTLDRRVRNKTGLQAELGLPLRTDVPMIGAIMRLVEQKGADILFPAVRQLLAERDVQFVLLGSGQYDYETMAWWLGHDFPDRVAIRLAFDEKLAERIYASSEVFAMPSVFEPCGIGQMIAMRYGSLPVVRAVGGLIDTVKPDVGFLFSEMDVGALRRTLIEALDLYHLNPDEWQNRQKRAMALDYSWRRSAERYVDLYEETIALRKRYA